MHTLRLKALNTGIIACLIAIMLLLSYIFTPIANAAQVTSRKITLGSSAASASTTHKFDFTTATTANIGSIKFQYCTTASGSCTAPTDLDVDGVSISAQTGGTGFSIDGTGTDANNIVITRSATSLAASTAVSYTFSSAENPSTSNTSFYVRITTYTSTDASTGSTDTGVVAGSTANQITVTATVDETLTFCVYTGVNCAASGSTVALGTLSSSSTATGTSKFDVGTNATSGYAVTYSGTTLTSGSNTVTALGTQSANGAGASSSTGSSQFGLNLRDNATPNVGTDKSGSGSYGTNYGTADSFRHFTGDTVATATGPTDSTTFTVSYIANIGTAQAAGAYTTTLTYICTATF